MERDHFASGLTNEQLNFNSHAHVERDAFDIETSSFYDDFNSHAHVERDGTQKRKIFQKHYISTHTLTWSVTSFNF